MEEIKEEDKAGECWKCKNGEMIRHFDRDILCRERICNNCGYTILDGFGWPQN